MKNVLPLVLLVVLVVSIYQLVQLSDEAPVVASPNVEQAISQALLSQTEMIPSGGGFTLQGANGPVSLSDFRGKLVALYFGYTWCPDVCPTSLGNLSVALNELTPEELALIQPIFISVDPERDDTQRLEQYAKFYHPALIGVTGTPSTIRELSSRYGVSYRKVETEGSAMGYSVDHSSFTYLIDSDGRLHTLLNHGSSPTTLVTAIHELLQQDYPSVEER